MPIDPNADRARRAWLPCPACRHGRDCHDCLANRNCGRHWQYLLGNAGPVVHLQGPDCAHLWSTDTRAGAARRKDVA